MLKKIMMATSFHCDCCHVSLSSLLIKTVYNLSRIDLSRNALPITLTELKLIAAAATIGFSTKCGEIG